MYQPRIADEHIHQLYQWAKRLGMPMTRLVNALLAHGIEQLEQGVENFSEQLAGEYPVKKGLLGDCVSVLEALLASPDLNLDCLEQATQDAIEVARETLQAVKAEIE